MVPGIFVPFEKRVATGIALKCHLLSAPIRQHGRGEWKRERKQHIGGIDRFPKPLWRSEATLQMSLFLAELFQHRNGQYKSLDRMRSGWLALHLIASATPIRGSASWYRPQKYEHRASSIILAGEQVPSQLSGRRILRLKRRLLRDTTRHN